MTRRSSITELYNQELNNKELGDQEINDDEELNDKKFISHKDPMLIKSIRRAEGLVKLNEQSNPLITPENVQHWVKWHAVTTHDHPWH